MDVENKKINCSFCGKEITCPKDMLNVEKHSCGDCFTNLGDTWSREETGKIHVDIPKDKLGETMSNGMTNSLVKDVFPKVWLDRKGDLKKMSKRELAEEMFGSGAYIALSSFIETIEENEKRERDMLGDSD